MLPMRMSALTGLRSGGKLLLKAKLEQGSGGLMGWGDMVASPHSYV